MTQKYRYRWPAILGVALAIWFVLGMTLWNAFAGGLENAAALALDRNLCGIQVDQKQIELQLIIGARENNVSIEQAVNIAGTAVIRGNEYMQERPMKEVVEYCSKRFGY